jgi:hypothetical protein
MAECFTRSVHHKVSNCHFAGGDKRNEARQKTKCDHEPADQLDDSA